MRIKWWLLAMISPAVILIDQATKYLVYSRFRWGETEPVLENFFALTYVRNFGAAFGLMHKAPAYLREPFFIIIPLVALAVILLVFTRLKDEQRWTALALSLILGGALGNLIDRLRFGYVVDFLDFHWKEVYHWPAFNVADSCIVVGVTIMFFLSLNQTVQEEKGKTRTERVL